MAEPAPRANATTDGPIRYLSVCSGIEAASIAWEALRWRPAAFSEIEPFPCHVLAHRHGASRPMFMPRPEDAGRLHPFNWLKTKKEKARRARNIEAMAALPECRPGDLPNFGDLERYKEWPDAAIDLLVGGTPCQSFSVAGLRKGMDDPRGNLALVYLGVADRYRPRWVVWENVPGVLSNNGGRDFGSFLGGLGKLGYGWAYRVLDAQYVRTRRFSAAVPQRRRRVFVVGYLGDWRPAASVLFDRESLRGNPPPRREAGKAAAGTLGARAGSGGGFGTDFDIDGGVVAQDVAASLDASYGRLHGASGQDANHGHSHLIAFDSKAATPSASGDGTTPTLRAMGHDGSHANGGGQIAIAFDTTQITHPANRSNPRPNGPCHPLSAMAHPPAVAFDMRGREGGAMPEGPHDTANIRAASGGSSRSYVATLWAVRRLTPIECERLQGFPDGYTDVPFGRRNRTPDGHRYKALGNSMAVNAMEWLGERIDLVEAILWERSDG